MAIELPIVVGVEVAQRECEQRRRVSRWDAAVMQVGAPPLGLEVARHLGGNLFSQIRIALQRKAHVQCLAQRARLIRQGHKHPPGNPMAIKPTRGHGASV